MITVGAGSSVDLVSRAELDATRDDMVVNVKDHGAVGGNAVDNTGIDAAISYAVANGLRRIYFPADTYRYNGVLQVNTRGLVFLGDRHGRPSSTGGTRIAFYVASGGQGGFQLGIDNGAAYGANDYTGVQGLTLQDLSLSAISNGAGTVPLLNGAGNYVPGSRGVRDWRGGDVRLTRVTMENFEHGFWGVASDLNRWEDTEFFYCKVGVFLGPRSDQFVSCSSYFFLNDTDLHIDGARQVDFYDYVTDSSGFGSSCPVKVTGAYGQSADAIHFYAPWLEHTAIPGTIDAWFDIGPSDADTQVGDVAVIDPFIGHARTIDTPPTHNAYLAKVGNVQSVAVRNPSGLHGLTNTDATVAFVGATSPAVYLEASGSYWQYANKSTNLGTGSPRMHFHRLTGYAATNQDAAQQALSNLLVQKSDAAPGSGAPAFAVHRDQAGARSFEVNSSGNSILYGGLAVNGRNFSSSLIGGISSYTAIWDPGTVANDAIATTTVAATGAVIGDPVFVGVQRATTTGLIVSVSVTASAVVTVTVHNRTGAAWTPGSGTVRVTVFGY